MNQQRLIALDADGVLLDYHAGYAQAWKKAFGETLQEVHPFAYHARQRFGVRPLDETQLQHLHEVGFDAQTWSSMPPLPGALQACRLLQDKGYHLCVVSALPERYGAARADNLLSLGFEFERVVATGTKPVGSSANPKQAALNELKPDVFVDDFLAYLQDLLPSVRRVLIDAALDGSPNRNRSLMPPHHRFASLYEFAAAWPVAH